MSRPGFPTGVRAQGSRPHHGLSLLEAPGSSGRLPFPVGAFVGRADDAARAGTLLGSSRLLTLTGSGGSGKTRLAIEVARRHQSRFVGGVWFIDLGAVRDERLVLNEIATAIGVSEPERGGSILEAIVRWLEHRDTLVIVDGCEHMVGPIGGTVSAMLEASGTLRVIATSREPLSIPGETLFTVPPLDREDAVALFVERAGQARPGISFDHRQTETVRRICDRLDCLPLAIELAAAKARTMSVARIASALDDQVRLLSSTGRSIPELQRTMRASFDWSHGLLTEAEARLLADLSVFRGGFELDDALAVCPDASVETLSALVERSLLSLDWRRNSGPDEDPRYRMLETIREFAAERLAAEPRVARDRRRRHARHYLGLAEAAEPNLTGDAQDAWLARLAIEVDNLRSALGAASEFSDSEVLARLAVALTPYWLERSQWSECRHWLLTAARPAKLSATRRARVLNRRCYLEMWSGDAALVPGLAAESLTLLEGLDEPIEQGRAHGFRAIAVSVAAGPEAARTEVQEALELLRAGGDPWGLGMLLAFFAGARLFHDKPHENRAMLDEAIGIATMSGDRRTLRLAEAFSACAAISQGRVADATGQAESALEAARVAGHATPMIISLFVQSWASAVGGDIGRSEAKAGECLTVSQESEESSVFDGLAMWAEAQAKLAAGSFDHAVPLLEEARRLTAPDRTWAALPVLSLAQAAIELDDATTAVATLEDAARLAETRGLVWVAGRVALLRARLADDPAQGEALVHQGFALAREGGDQLVLVDGLEALADLAMKRRDDPMAVRLWAAASSARASLGYARTARDKAAREELVGGATKRLGAERATALRAEGEGLSLDDALAYAARGRGSRRRPRIGWYSLTPAESEVTRLIAQHRTNPEIARLLFISRATVKTHLLHIFAKVGISNRSELAAEAIRRGLATRSPAGPYGPETHGRSVDNG
jgi:predicted ATPase/DNA-binding CsgD family transcriptional regulator